MVTNRLDPNKWQKGTAGKPAANLFNVLGFTQPNAYPQLDTSLTQQVANAVNNGSQSPGNPGSGGIPALPASGKYSFAQLQDIWEAGGGAARYKLIAAAIAMAESGGYPKAVNTANTNGTTDRGLWQINSSHGSQSVFDVLKNAQAAVAISGNGSNWAPWSTFNNGAYAKFLPSPIPAGQWVPGSAGNPNPGGISGRA